MLRDYQIKIAEQAAHILVVYNLVYLAMQVRTGKTLTALATAENYDASSVLFLTKKKAIASIEGDYKLLSPSFNIHVTNHEQAGNIKEDHYDLIIIDEAHCLGQYPIPAQRVKDIKAIVKDLPVIYLSGTPTPESFSQIFHQFYVSAHSPFPHKNFYRWADDFVTVKKKYLGTHQINDYSNADEQKIKSTTGHLFLTYTQGEAGFSCEVTEHIITVKMKSSTYWLAERLRTRRVYIGKNGEELLGDTAIKLMQKTHQIFSGTVIFEDGNSSVFDYTKAEYIRDNFTGKKIAIFYKFQAEKNMLLWIFKGEVTESPEEFATTNLVFISQIQSGREGINLSSADAIIFLNIDFSYLSYEQGRARLQSLHRATPAMVYWIFAENGIEHKIYERVINKKDYTLAYYKKDFNIERVEDKKPVQGDING